MCRGGPGTNYKTITTHVRRNNNHKDREGENI